MASDNAAACHVCGMVKNAKDEAVVYRDGDWMATSYADAPGVVMMFTSEHDAGLRSMSPSAAASLGPILAKMSAAMVEDGSADRVALMHLGDNSIHTHFALVARQGGGDPIADLSGLGARVKSTTDKAATDAMIGRIRRALG
jgi:diadenosine tetraphosphate (Ap4A) HIT family hydrolase